MSQWDFGAIASAVNTPVRDTRVSAFYSYLTDELHALQANGEAPRFSNTGQCSAIMNEVLLCSSENA